MSFLKSIKLELSQNNTKERLNLLVEEYALNMIFSPIIPFVCYWKHKKNSLIFQKALESVDCNASECVFIDNHKKNLKIPDEMGFKTYLFDPAENDIKKMKNELSEFGVVI